MTHLSARTLYDELSFSSRPSPERSLDRLWWIASFRGMEPTLPAAARVLELGCSTGRHLSAMAEQYPHAKFVGVDISGEQIQAATAFAERCGLSNIEFTEGDFSNFRSHEPFDYIICHGIYSWIPEEVREHLLGVLRECLAPSGVAYLSHNTLPGWNSRAIVRSILAITDNPEDEIACRIARARSVLELGAERLIDAFRPYGLQVKEELERNVKRSDSFILHELLNPNASAQLLADVIADGRRYALQYLGDAHPSRMQSVDDLFEELPEDLGMTGEQKAQFLDLLHPASFRGTLFCHSSEKLTAEPVLSVIGLSWIASPLVYAADEYSEADLLGFKMVPFIGPSEEVEETKAPALKILLRRLAECWPEAVSFSEVVESLKHQDIFSEGEEQQLQQHLFRLYCRNLLDIYPEALPVRRMIPDKPRVASVVREEVDASWVSTIRGELYQVDALDRILFPLMDGTRTVQELTDRALEAIRSGVLRIEIEGKKVDLEEAGTEEAFREEIAQKFTRYGEQALFASLND